MAYDAELAIVPGDTGRREFYWPVRLLFALMFLGMLGFPQVTQSADAQRPNVVFVLADDLGPGDLGCYGGRIALTPHLDQMAAQGTRFTQYYSGAPICSPSRAALVTGMFPARWRITSFLQTRKGNADCQQADFLDPRAPSLARTLRAAGYATAHFGKWHLGGGRDVVHPPKFAEYGFDEHAGTYESPEPHADITAKDWIWSPEDKVKRWDRSAFFVDRALDFLKRHKGAPAFINIWLDDPHTPWVPSDDQFAAQPDGPEPHRKLRAVLIEMDRQVGRLLAGIKELGIDRQTLVIFISDNGPLPTFDGRRSVGLRGSKLSLYEGGIRVPLIALWPGHVPAGVVDETSVVSAVDWFPTICKLAEVAIPADAQLDGEDHSAALSGMPTTRVRPLLWEYGRNETSFAYPKGRDRSPNLAIRDGKWKLLVSAAGEGAELYDLAADPRETTNLADKHPELVAKMQDAALAWRKSLP